MELKFQKFCGSGNDFIIIDNRNFKKMIKNRAEFAKKHCQRGISVGADGVIFVENSTVADFKMVLFQPDGSEAEMCGNGSRCLANYAHLNGIANKEMKFETLAGIIEGIIYDNSVSVKLTEPQDLKLDEKISINEPEKEFQYNFINTGVPHTVIYKDDLDSIPIKIWGNRIRFHNNFKPAGTNVNFVKKIDDKTIKIRTYERGVEDETLACGTGSTASALISSLKHNMESPVRVITQSGIELKIHFNKTALINKDFSNLQLFLEGDADKIYEGIMEVEDSYYNC